MLKSQQKVDTNLSKICQNHQKFTSGKSSLHASLKLFTILHLKTQENVGIFSNYLLTFWILLNKGEPELNINDINVGSCKQCLGLLNLLALLCSGNYTTQLLETQRKNLYRQYFVSFALLVFLILTHNDFFDAFH